MRTLNLQMTARMKAVVEMLKRAFGEVPRQMQTWSARRLRGEHTHDFHGNYWFVIRHTIKISFQHILVHPMILLWRWMGHNLMDISSRMAGVHRTSMPRGSQGPMTLAWGDMDYDAAQNLVMLPPYIGFEPSYSITLDQAETKLKQLYVAHGILQECAFLYDSYHEYLEDRSSIVVRNAIYATIVIRLAVLYDDGKKGKSGKKSKYGLNDAVYAMLHDPRGRIADQELASDWNWVHKIRNSVLAHVDTKDVASRIDVRWERAHQYEDVLYPVYTDLLARDDVRYGFLGTIYITKRTVQAVDRIMRRPIKVGDGIEIQITDLAYHMLIKWQHMIAKRYKGCNLIWKYRKSVEDNIND